MNQNLLLAIFISLSAFAGVGVLLSFGYRPATLSARVGAATFGYILALAFMMAAGQILLVLGLPPLVAVIIFLLWGVIGWLRALPLAKMHRLYLPEATTILAWAMVAFVFIILFTLGLAAALNTPLWSWEAWSLTAGKALMIDYSGGLPADLWRLPVYEFIRPSEPLGLSVIEVIFMQLGGSGPRIASALIWLVFPAAGASAAFLLPKPGRRWLPLLAAFLLLPAFNQAALNGSVYFLTGLLVALSLLTYLRFRDERQSWLMAALAILLAGLGTISTLAAVVAIVLLVVFMIASRPDDLLPASLSLAVTVIVWQVWVAVSDVPRGWTAARIFDVNYLADNFDRLGDAAEAMARNMVELQQPGLVAVGALWSAILLASLILLVCSWRQVEARIIMAVFSFSVAAVLVLYWAGFDRLGGPSLDQLVFLPATLLIMGGMVLLGKISWAGSSALDGQDDNKTDR